MAAKKKAAKLPTASGPLLPEGALQEMIAKAVADALGTAQAGPAPKGKKGKAAKGKIPMPVVPKNALPAQQMAARVQHWWETSKPLLHRAWMFEKQGFGQKQAQSLITAIANLYEQAHVNLHGEPPSDAPPRQYEPGWD